MEKDNWQKSDGFSLMELLIALIIVSILLKIGMGMLHSPNVRSNSGSEKIFECILEAKSQAILYNSPIILRINNQDIMLEKGGKEFGRFELANNIEVLQVRGKDYSQEAYIEISRNGIVQESLLHVTENNTRKSFYIPGIGDIIVIENHISIEDVYRDYL